ncbi:metallophosphoesterase [Propionibacteriaceae bacterium G57]|uniref:metallophosphoesterase n=1 Tax=Aestuariimicrobium sp. G57 TaxID=3418485 RepID=UPI003DA70939
MRLSEYPHPDHLLVHVSDTHFAAEQVNPATLHARERLQTLMSRLAQTGLRPEALVFSGDIADRGEPDAYAMVREVVDPAAEAMGAKVIWVMGNHDDRGAFRAGLMGEASADGEVDRVEWVGGLRIVVLDSTVPGHHWGEVTERQRGWLAEVLSEPAPQGTILAMHHPPVPCVQDLAITVELRDQRLLRPILEGSDVRAILGGHVHYSTFATFAGIPVSVAASTCYTQDLFMPGRGTAGRDAAQALNLVSVYDSTVLHSVIPIDEGVRVGRVVDELSTTRMLAEEGVALAPRRGELFAR